MILRNLDLVADSGNPVVKKEVQASGFTSDDQIRSAVTVPVEYRNMAFVLGYFVRLTITIPDRLRFCKLRLPVAASVLENEGVPVE